MAQDPIRVDTGCDQYQSQSTELTHGRIRVNRSRHSRKLSRRGTIILDKTGTRSNQIRSQATESTQDVISYNHSQPRRHINDQCESQ